MRARDARSPRELGAHTRLKALVVQSEPRRGDNLLGQVGVSGARVRQIEERAPALAKLRQGA